VIDARAIVSAEAELAANVCIGPFSIIGPRVRSARARWSDRTW